MRIVGCRRVMVSRHHRQGEAAELEVPLAVGMARRHFLRLGDGLEEAVVEMRVHAHVVVDEEQLALQRGDVEAIALEFRDRRVHDGGRTYKMLEGLEQL
jgi:hypothetical protein